MTVDRRHLLLATAGATLAAGTLSANAVPTRHRSPASFVDFDPGRGGDITARLQRTIEYAATLGHPVQIAPGYYEIRGAVRLMAGTKLIGPHGLATFDLRGEGALVAENASDIVIAGLTITGAANTRSTTDAALLSLNTCANLQLSDVVFHTAPHHAVQLWRSSGRINHCRFEHIADTAIKAGDSTGLDICHNQISHAGNNGIVVWREKAGADGTSLTSNHISHIRSDAGGSGQNGNAINAFRAENVIIQGNIIAHCAYSAVRCNAASNAQIIANNCRDIGEVALYAEFAFQGAVIANNIVDHAATGIEVTNFKEGGRLATIQGNIIRNLFRREHEKVDKRGIGISVEADTVVSGNTIENAATAGISIGWGQWISHVAATSNLIRETAIGITVSALGKPGSVLIASNIISSSRNGAVRLFNHDTPVGEALANQPMHAATSPDAPAILQGNIIS